MRLALQFVFWAVGLSLQVLVIRALLSGPYKRYPLLFTYSVTVFLTTLVEVTIYVAQQMGQRGWARSWRFYYWINDAILQALVFAVVISLIHHAMTRANARTAIRRWLIVGAFLAFAVFFALHVGPEEKLSAWMTLVSRDLSFSAVILDLLLWTTLVASKKKDQELLMLSGGLGIQFTGSAIGQSIRQLALGPLGKSPAMALTGSVIVVVANLICLYVWWQTFRRPFPRRVEKISAS